MARKAMTQKEYVRRKGCACPACGRSNVEAGNMEADGNSVYSEVTCRDCGATWTDHFKLAGYCDLQRQDGE